MTGRWSEMVYEAEQACWMVRSGSRLWPMRCGECFELRVGDRGMQCRLELDRQWYVIVQEVRFNLRERECYLIRLV